MPELLKAGGAVRNRFGYALVVNRCIYILSLFPHCICDSSRYFTVLHTHLLGSVSKIDLTDDIIPTGIIQSRSTDNYIKMNRTYRTEDNCLFCGCGDGVVDRGF